METEHGRTDGRTVQPVKLAVCQAVVGIVVVVAEAVAQSFNYTLDEGARENEGKRKEVLGRNEERQSVKRDGCSAKNIL